MYDQAKSAGQSKYTAYAADGEKEGNVNCIYGTWYYWSGILVYSIAGPIGIVGLILSIVGRKRVEGAWQPLVLLCQLLPIVLAVINAIAGVYLQTSNVLNQL